jgi:predicted Zn-dependent protease
MKRSIMAALIAAVVGGPVMLAGCGGALISREQEIAMGREAAPEFEQEFGGLVQDAALQDYVDMVGQRVAARSDRDMPYEFDLLRSDVPNAFALPGGKIYITAGLMSDMENERELAAVLAHEVAHVAQKHNVAALERQLGASVLLELASAALGGTEGQIAEVAGGVVAGMVQLRYSRNAEYEADTFGIRYMERAGYNPWGMIELLTTLKNLSDSEPGSFAEMFSTHPLTSKRIEEARQTVRSEYSGYATSASDPSRDRFMQMRQRLVASGQIVPQSGQNTGRALREGD